MYEYKTCILMYKFIKKKNKNSGVLFVEKHHVYSSTGQSMQRYITLR